MFNGNSERGRNGLVFTNGANPAAKMSQYSAVGRVMFTTQTYNIHL